MSDAELLAAATLGAALLSLYFSWKQYTVVTSTLDAVSKTTMGGMLGVPAPDESPEPAGEPIGA